MELCLGGEKLDLRSGLERAGPGAGQEGAAGGTKYWGAWPIASLLARGLSTELLFCLEKEFREQPSACCLEWKHTQNEKTLKPVPLRSDFKWSHSRSQIDSMQRSNKPPQFLYYFINRKNALGIPSKTSTWTQAQILTHLFMPFQMSLFIKTLFSLKTFSH